MRHVRLLGLVLVVATGCLSVGCNDDKAKLAAMQKENGDLQTRVRDLQIELDQAQTKQSDLQAAVGARDSDLAAARQEIAALKAKQVAAKPAAPAAPAAGSTAGGWERGLAGDKIEVGSDVLFSPGQATLTTAGKAALDKIAGDIKSHYGSLPVRVYGYTDADPIVKTKNLWQDNLDLSANRAMAVTRYLVSKGVAATKIETVAMGANSPVASNSSAANKAKNRRVEIVVVKA